MIFAIFQMTISSRVYEYAANKKNFFERAIFLIYQVKIFHVPPVTLHASIQFTEALR